MLFFRTKKNLGLDNVCNSIRFGNYGFKSSKMMIKDYGRKTCDISINWAYFLNQNKKVDEHNYDIMFSLLHELTHVYQLTREEETNNIFDRLIYYDYQKENTLIKHATNDTNPLFHQSLITEYTADEQAKVFLLNLMERHPEYFNDELIKKRKLEYKQRKDGTYGNFGCNPRKAFDELIADIKKAYARSSKEEVIKPLMNEIEDYNKKSDPLIKYLGEQGISEKGWEHYYSIFLNTYYNFDGENLVINSKKNKMK